MISVTKYLDLPWGTINNKCQACITIVIKIHYFVIILGDINLKLVQY